MSARKSRELTPREKQSIRRLIQQCANYDGAEKECLPLETGCAMLAIGFNTSILCRYFREAVLPLDPALSAVLNHQPVKACQWCGKDFPVKGRKAYCSEGCAAEGQRERTARRVQKHRKKGGTM